MYLSSLLVGESLHPLLRKRHSAFWEIVRKLLLPFPLHFLEIRDGPRLKFYNSLLEVLAWPMVYITVDGKARGKRRLQ